MSSKPSLLADVKIVNKKPVTFHVPRFDKSIPNKVNIKIATLNPTTLKKIETPASVGVSAVATEGFAPDIDGTHVFVTKIHSFGSKSPSSFPLIGFASVPTLPDQNSPGELCSYDGPAGIALKMEYGVKLPYDVRPDPYGELGNQNAFKDINICQKATEVISVLVISDFGRQLKAYWIVDGVPCRMYDVTKSFPTAANLTPEMRAQAPKILCKEIFPAVTLEQNDSQIGMISFDLVKSRSDAVNALKQPFVERLRDFFLVNAPYNVNRVDTIAKNVLGSEQSGYIKQLCTIYGVDNFEGEEDLEIKTTNTGKVGERKTKPKNPDSVLLELFRQGNISKQETSTGAASSKKSAIQNKQDTNSSISTDESESDLRNLVGQLQRQLREAELRVQRTEQSMRQQVEAAQQQVINARTEAEKNIQSVKAELEKMKEVVSKLQNP